MSGRLDRAYQVDEQLALARERLRPVTAAIPPMVAVAALLRVLRDVLTKAHALIELQASFRELFDHVVRLDDDVRRLFEKPMLPGLEMYQPEAIDAYGDRYDWAARTPADLPGVVQLVMFGVELLRCERLTMVTVGQREEWKAIEGAIADLGSLCALGPIDEAVKDTGERVH